MRTDVFQEYCEYKVKTLYQYSMLLNKILAVDTNRLWRNKKTSELIFYSTIKKYFDKYVTNKSININIISVFFKDNSFSSLHIEKELIAIIEYFMENKRIFDINKYEKEIVLLAIIIHIANELDIVTSPFIVNRNNYNTIINQYIAKYNQIDFINIIDQGKKNINELLELIKTNVRKERRIFDLLTVETSFNKYIAINSDNVAFLTQYNYAVTNLDKFDYDAGKVVYETGEVNIKFLLLSIDLIIITIIKEISCRRKISEFLIPIPKRLLNSEKALKTISLLKDKTLKKYIKFFIRSEDITNASLAKIDEYLINKYYIYYKNAVKNFKIESSKEYILNKEYYQKYQYLFNEVLSLEKITIENFGGTYEDKDLILVKSKEKEL